MQTNKTDVSHVTHKIISRRRASLFGHTAKIAVLVTWPSDQHVHWILHLPSEFRINRPVSRRYIAKKRFSIWRPPAILNLLWRHHFASEKCNLYSQLFLLNFHDFQLRVFWNTLYFTFHHLAWSCLFRVSFWRFLVIIGKNVKVKYNNPQKTHPWPETRLLSGATCRRAEENIKRKEGRRKHPKQWKTGYSPRPPTSSDQNQTLHGEWPAVCTCQVWFNSVKGGVENGPSRIRHARRNRNIGNVDLITIMC